MERAWTGHVGRTMVALLLSAGWLLCGRAAAQGLDSVSVQLEAMVDEAIDRDPSILAELAEVEQLEARVHQVSQPFDPMLTVGIANLPVDSFRFDEHNMTGVPIGLSERFYWPGVLDARADEARTRADTRAAYVPEAVVRIWMAAVEPYIQVLALDRAMAVLNERRSVLVELYEATRARYAARAVSLTDVNRVSIEISRVDQDVAAVESGRRVAVARLNGILNRPATTPVSVEAPERPFDPGGEVDSWLARGLENRPIFEALSAEQQLVGAREVAAEADDDPIWSLGVAYALRFQDGPPGSDVVSLNVGITLPFFSARRVDAMLDELGARRIEIDHDRAEVVRQLRADIGTHLEAMASLRREVAVLVEELIPAVQETYESTLAHYASSHMAVETLIEIHDRLLELELARMRLISAHDLHAASLRALTADSEALADRLRRP